MLMVNEERVAEQGLAASPSTPNATCAAESWGMTSDTAQTRLQRVLRIEWLGQTVASLCWIGSVLAYGISSSGDWLQLCAASSWLLANIAAALTVKAD